MKKGWNIAWSPRFYEICRKVTWVLEMLLTFFNNTSNLDDSKAGISWEIIARSMVFVIFDGIVFCNKSCFEKNDFFYWNCCNWWCFPLWIININWIKYCYRQNIEKYSNYHTKSCFLNCEFKIWFHFGIPNHVFMISFNYVNISSNFAQSGSFLHENVELFAWKHWTEYKFYRKVAK